MKFLTILLLLVCLSCYSSASLDTNWWKQTEIYDIIISTFKDTDGDGFGDLKGVTSKLDYVKELGISTIKLSPIFASVYGLSSWYGVEDFKKIHLTLGNMEDFDELIKEAKAKKIRVILDFLINHCSTSHEWFKKSQNKIDPYTDYFIWKNKKKSSQDYEDWNEGYYWKFDTIRKQKYYHYYRDSVADLNFRNEAVKEEVKKLIKFWLDKGVSGLNLLSANAYVEYALIAKSNITDETNLRDQPESYEFVHELREYVDTYNKENGGSERILIVDYADVIAFPNLHGNATYPIAHIVSHYAFRNRGRRIQSLESDFFSTELIENRIKKENAPTLLLSTTSPPDGIINPFENKQLLDVWLTIALMLPTSMLFFNSQEIGLSSCRYSHRIQREQRPFGSAMAWDDSLNAGFTDNEFTLLPPNVDSWEINLENMKNTKFSTFHLTKDLLQLRKTQAFRNGDLKSIFISTWIYAFKRSYKNEEMYVVLLNLENKDNLFDLSELSKDQQLPETIRVVTSSFNSVYRKGDVIETKSRLWLRTTSSVVFAV